MTPPTKKDEPVISSSHRRGRGHRRSNSLYTIPHNSDKECLRRVQTDRVFSRIKRMHSGSVQILPTIREEEVIKEDMGKTEEKHDEDTREEGIAMEDRSMSRKDYSP